METASLHNDTICAISTPAGVGGIAVLRVSGPSAIEIAGKIWHGKPLAEAKSHTVHYGSVTDSEGNVVDDCVATIFRAPHSFTGEDVVELSVHGSIYVQQTVLQLLTAGGARIAERGEFTRRAFASGKMDLAQAEGVADLIASRSRAAHDIAMRQMKGGFSKRLTQLHDSLLNLASLLELELDFSEEDVEFASRKNLMDQAIQLRDEIQRLASSFARGNAIKEGIPVAIVGPTNAGKSSLLNLLAGDERAIVSDIHGTTRDLIEDTVNIGDYTFRFIDTAGLRDTEDTIERLGIDRSRKAMSRATIILHVIDATTLSSDSSDNSDNPDNPDSISLPSLDSLDSLPSLNSLNSFSSLDSLDSFSSLNSLNSFSSLDSLDSLPSLNSLNSLPSLNSLNSLPSLDSLNSLPSPNSFEPLPSLNSLNSLPSLNSLNSLPSLDSLDSLPSLSGNQTLLTILNKTDLLPSPRLSALDPRLSTIIPLSAKTGAGIDRLQQILQTIASRLTTGSGDIIITNARHHEALQNALLPLHRVIDGLNANLTGDLIAQDLREVLHHLGTITGTITTPDILATIFTRFCVGK